MLYEDDVVAAVVNHLRDDGWVIERAARATEHGDDIVANRGDDLLVVEAKGEGSSKPRGIGAPLGRRPRRSRGRRSALARHP